MSKKFGDQEDPAKAIFKKKVTPLPVNQSQYQTERTNRNVSKGTADANESVRSNVSGASDQVMFTGLPRNKRNKKKPPIAGMPS